MAQSNNDIIEEDLSTNGLTGSDLDFEIIQENEFQECITTNGITGISSLIKSKLEKYKTVKLNMGFIGMSGSGKSTFLNSLRNLQYSEETENDPNVAKTGETETTMDPTPYKYLENEGVNLWDLPGVNTSKFPKQTYLDQVKCDEYDCFFICSSTRFHEDDLWLAQEIRKRGKNFFLIRTKLDVDIDNRSRFFKRPLKSQEEEEIKNRITDECKRQLKANNLPNDRVYLISSLIYNPDNRHKWDFPALQEDILGYLEGEKKNAFLMLVTPRAENLLKIKSDYLRSRINKVAVLCGVTGLIPIPGISFLFDITALINEIELYKSQLGLKKEAMEHLANETGCSFHEITGIVQNSGWSFLILEGSDALASTLVKKLAEYAALNFIEEGLKSIPIVGLIFGSLTGGVLSFATISYALRKILNEFEATAIKVLNFCIDKQKCNQNMN